MARIQKCPVHDSMLRQWTPSHTLTKGSPKVDVRPSVWPVEDTCPISPYTWRVGDRFIYFIIYNYIVHGLLCNRPATKLKSGRGGRSAWKNDNFIPSFPCHFIKTGWVFYTQITDVLTSFCLKIFTKTTLCLIPIERACSGLYLIDGKTLFSIFEKRYKWKRQY